jgi:hypothetical protein
VRHTSRAGAKAGYSDPRALCGRCRAYRIKATPGITESSRLSVPSVGAVCYLDVGSSHPGAEEGPKGLSVRQLKRYASWVQTVVRQVGLYPPRALDT